MLLAQPPNSSSAATLGAGLKPPPEPGTMGVLAKAPPLLPQPKSLGGAGAATAGAGLLWTAGAVGSFAAHSFPPHASKLGAANEGVAFGAGCAGAAVD